MTGLRGLLLLTVAALALITLGSTALSPAKMCPRSFTVQGKCVKERRETTTVHYGYDRMSGRCTRRESRAVRPCGVESNSACRCYISGDPHYVTYDNQNMHFFGKCTYLLTKPVSGGSRGCKWSVEGKNRMRGGSPFTYLEEVTVHLNGKAYKLGQNRRLYINDVFHGLPFRSEKPDIMVQYMGTKIVLHSRQCGFRVSFDGDAEAIIKVDGRYRGKLTGICGNCDGKRNDLRTAEGRDVSGLKNKFTLIGNSFLAPGLDKSCTGPDNVRCSDSDMRRAKRACAGITDSTSPFGKCMTAGKVSLIKFRNDCIQDMCAASHFAKKHLVHEARCQSFAAAAEICSSRNFVSKDWRSVAQCRLRCPSGMRYSSNRKTCPETCESLFFGINSCPAIQSEGCFCKPGLVLDGNLCVKKEDCRCLQCADMRNPADCAEWKMKGRCSSEPEVMYKYCRLTCNMCEKHKCIDLIATNICIKKREEGKCADSFFKEFCGLTCNWETCKCPDEGVHIRRGHCRRPDMVRQVTKTTVFRSRITGICTSASLISFEPCGNCPVINKVEKKKCDYCSGQRKLNHIVQHREGIYCRRRETKSVEECTCAFPNGKVKYLHAIKCVGEDIKTYIYMEKKVSKDCLRCDLIKSKRAKKIICTNPPPAYNPADKCPRVQNSLSKYTRTECQSRAVKCTCNTRCESKIFDCGCDCTNPVGQEDCEIFRQCDRLQKRLIVKYRAQMLVKDKFGDGVCTSRTAIVHVEERPCNYERKPFYTCDKDKTGRIIGCPTSLEKKWPPRWYNYREGYLDGDCQCKIKVERRVYQDNYCCCPKPYIIRELNEEYGTGKCVKVGDHYRMLVVRISFVYNSETGECISEKTEWNEVCRCDNPPEKEECRVQPNYALYVQRKPRCNLIDGNTPRARCQCDEKIVSRKVVCRKSPRYLPRKGPCDIRRGGAIYRKVYREIMVRKRCSCVPKVLVEQEPCRECSPDNEKRVIPCPRDCNSKKSRCSVNCKSYEVYYRYTWNDVSKMCVRREIYRLESRCCCKPYYIPPDGPGTDEKQEIGPICHLSGKYWKYYINRQYLCGKRYKKCCRDSVRRLEPIKCKIGKRRKAIKCKDGRNVRQFEVTRVFLRECKCQKRIKIIPCKCRCPKSRSFRHCERETNTIADVSEWWVIRDCRCHKLVETKRRRRDCEVTSRKEVYNNYEQCMAGKTRAWLYVRKFSRFYMNNCDCFEKPLNSITCNCKCPRKRTTTKERCNGLTGFLEWRETSYVKSGCLCRQRSEPRKREFTCPTQRDRIEVKCNEKTGVQVTTQFNFRRIPGTCRCDWVKVDEKLERCNCDIENTKIEIVNRRNEKHPTCRYNRWHYETYEFYLTVRNGRAVCVERIIGGDRDIPCNRDESVLPEGPCNTRRRVQRYQKIWFELRSCICAKQTSYFAQPCGCRKDQPQERRKIGHHCDRRGNWIITWEFYRWDEKRQVCDRGVRKESRPVFCKQAKRRVSKTGCYKGHYQVTEHWDIPVHSKCICKSGQRIVVLPCVCPTIERNVGECYLNVRTGHWIQKRITVIRSWNSKEEKCEVSKRVVIVITCKCKKREKSKPKCLHGNWVSKSERYELEVDKRGDRVCIKIVDRHSVPHVCTNQVRFKTKRNKCNSRRTDTIYEIVTKLVLRRKDCDCVDKIVRRTPCKCWCSNRRVFLYSRCQDDKVNVFHYSVERLEGCRCVKRRIRVFKTINCKSGIVKRTKGACNRKAKCTRPVFGWVNVARNCRCVPSKLDDPVGQEKCDCCKKPREIGAEFCERGIMYRYITTRTWQPSKRECKVIRDKTARGVPCPRIKPKDRFEYSECKKYHRVKYTVYMELNLDSCICEKKKKFFAIVWCKCPKGKVKRICVNNEYFQNVVTEHTLQGEECVASRSYSPRAKVRCILPPKLPDGRGGKMNCIRIRNTPFAKVVNCVCQTGYKTKLMYDPPEVWCCDHLPECKRVSKPYCDKKSNTWFSTVSRCDVVNKQCILRTTEKSGLTVVCSSKPVGTPLTVCNQKTMIEVTTTVYERPENCGCSTYTVTTTSLCGCRAPYRYIRHEGGRCINDNTWLEEIVEKTWNPARKDCEENVVSRRRRKIECVTEPTQTVLPGPDGKSPCYQRAGRRFKVKNVELKYYRARKCHCEVYRTRVIEKNCDCPEDQVKVEECDYDKTCMKRRITISYKAVSDNKGDMHCVPKSKREKLRCCCNEKPNMFKYCDQKTGHFITVKETSIFKPELLTCKTSKRLLIQPKEKCFKRFPADRSDCRVESESGIGYEVITTRVRYLNKRSCGCDTKTEQKQFVCSCPKCGKWSENCENNARVWRRTCYKLIKPKSGEPFCQAQDEKRSETVPCNTKERIVAERYPKHCSKPEYQTITIHSKRLEECKCIPHKTVHKKIRCCPRKTSKTVCHTSGKYWVKSIVTWHIDEISNNCARKMHVDVIHVPCRRFKKFFAPWKCSSNGKHCDKRPFNFIIKQWYRVQNCKCVMHREKKQKNMCCCPKKWTLSKCDCMAGRKVTKHFFQIVKSRKNRPSTCVTSYRTVLGPKLTCQSKYKVIPKTPCPKYKPGMKVPYQAFIERRGFRNCCKCGIRERVVHKPCRCKTVIKYSGKCKNGDIYRRVYLITNTIQFDESGLPKCVYTGKIFIGRDYCDCIPDITKKILTKKRCEGDSYIYTYQYKTKTTRCFKVQGLRICLNECITKQIVKKVPVDCPPTGLVFRGECIKEQRNVCRQLPYVENCVCRHKKDCFKKEACNCKKTRRYKCDTKTNTKVTYYKTCRPVKDTCVCNERADRRKVECDVPRTRRLIDCGVKRGYAFYHLDETTYRVPGSCTCLPKTKRKLIFCRCRKNHKSRSECIDGRIWRTVFKQYTWAGGKLGCVRRVKISDQTVSCPSNPQLVPGSIDRRTCNRDNVVIYNVLKACRCSKKSISVRSRGINCCTQSGFSAPPRCNRRTNVWITEHYHYVTSFNGFLFELGNVRIPTYKCDRTLVGRTRKPTICPETKVMESCNEKDGEAGIWTKTITTYRKKDCRCVPSVKVVTGLCHCPISYIYKSSQCINNFRTYYWRIYPRRPTRGHKCPFRVVPKKERCDCNRKEAKVRKCDRRGNWVTTLYYTIFKPKLKKCEKIATVISVEQAQCKENRYGVPSKGCSLKNTKCVKEYKDTTYTLNPTTCKCKPSVKVSRNKRCCCKKSKKTKVCVDNSFWKLTTVSYALDEEEKCIRRLDRSVVPIECPSSYKVKGDCIGNPKNGNCGYRLEHHFVFVLKKCRCIPRQTTKKVLCNNYCDLCRKQLKDTRQCNNKDGGKTYVSISYEYKLKRINNKPICNVYETSRRLENVECSPDRVEKSTYEKCGRKTGCKFNIYYYKMVPSRCKCISVLQARKTKRNLKCSCNCEKSSTLTRRCEGKSISFTSVTYNLRHFQCEVQIKSWNEAVVCDKRPDGWVFQKDKCVRDLIHYQSDIQNCKCSYTPTTLKTCRYSKASCCPKAPQDYKKCVNNHIWYYYSFFILPGCRTCKTVKKVHTHTVVCPKPDPQLVLVTKAPDGAVMKKYKKIIFKLENCICRPYIEFIVVPNKCPDPKTVITKRCPVPSPRCEKENVFGSKLKTIFGIVVAANSARVKSIFAGLKCKAVASEVINFPCYCRCPVKSRVCFNNKFWRIREVKYVKTALDCARKESLRIEKVQINCQRREREYRHESKCPKSGFYTIMKSYHVWKNCKCKIEVIKVGNEICRCQESDYKQSCNRAGNAFIGITTYYRLCGDKLKCCRHRRKKVIPINCAIGKASRKIRCDVKNHVETVILTTLYAKNCNCAKRETFVVQPCVTCLPPRCRVGKKTTCINNTWVVEIWSCQLYQKPGDWRKKCIQRHQISKRPYIQCNVGVVKYKSKCNPLTGEQLHLTDKTTLVKCECKKKTFTKRCDCSPCRKTQTYTRCLTLPMRWQKTTISWSHNGCKCIRHEKKEHIPIPCEKKKFVKSSGKCIKRKSGGGFVGFRKVTQCRKHLFNCACVPVCKTVSKVCFCQGSVKRRKCEHHNTKVTVQMRLALDKAANSCIWLVERIERKIVKPCQQDKIERSGCVYKSKEGGENYRVVKTTKFGHHQCACVIIRTDVNRETCDCDHRWTPIKQKCYGPKGNCNRIYILRRYVNTVRNGRIECVKDIRKVTDKCCCKATAKKRFCDKERCVFVNLITHYVLTGRYRKRFCQKSEQRTIEEPPCIRNKDITRVKIDRSKCIKKNLMRLSFQRQVCRDCKCDYAEYRFEHRVCRCNYVAKRCKCILKGTKERCVHIYERMSSDRKRCIRVKNSYEIPVVCSKRPEDSRICNVRRKDKKGYTDKYYTVRKYKRRWLFNKKRGTCRCVWEPKEYTNELCSCQPYKPEQPYDYFEYQRYCDKSRNTYVVLYKKRVRRGNTCTELIREKRNEIKCEISLSWRQRPDPPCPIKTGVLNRVFERGYKDGCKCEVKTRVEPCRCRCPEPVFKQRCFKDVIEVTSISHKLLNCKCIKVEKKFLKKFSCPKDYFKADKSSTCIETRVRVTFQKTACTKCTKKVEKTVDNWCCQPLPPNMREKIDCDKDNAIKITRRFSHVLIGTMHPNRQCKLTETKETKEIFCDNLSRSTKIISSCQKRDGFLDKVRKVRYFTSEFNGEACGCVWSRHHRWEVCLCRPERTVISTCNHQTCQQEIRYYTYQKVKNYRGRNTCRESVKKTLRRCGCCRKDYKTGPKCDGKRTYITHYYSFRWDYTNMTCIKHHSVKRKDVECGERRVTHRSKPNRATCTYTITHIRNSVNKCKCKKDPTSKVCFFCCRPRRLKRTRCRNHSIIETTVSKWVPVDCKCRKAKSRVSLKVVKCKKRFVTRCYDRNPRTCKQKCCKFECQVRGCKKVKPLIRRKCWHRVYKCCQTGLVKFEKCDEKRQRRVFTTSWYVWRPWRCDMHTKFRVELVRCNQRASVEKGTCSIMGKRSRYLQVVMRRDVVKRDVYTTGCQCKEISEPFNRICACKGYHDKEVCTGNTYITYRRSWVVRRNGNGVTFCFPVVTVIANRVTKCKKPHYRLVGNCKEDGMQTVQLVTEYPDDCNCKEIKRQFEMVCSCPKSENDKKCEYEIGRIVITTTSYVKVCTDEYSCKCKKTKSAVIKDVTCPQKEQKCDNGRASTITYTRDGCVCTKHLSVIVVPSCDGCYDFVDDCASQKRRGYCETNSETKESCKETCGLCPHPCVPPKTPVFKPQRGISIKSNTRFNKYFYIKTFRNKKAAYCMLECKKLPSCKSFDYDLSSSTCVLNTVPKEDIVTRGYTWNEKYQRSPYNIHYTMVCQDKCQCKVRPIDGGKCSCQGIGVERWCARRFAILQYEETSDGRCQLSENSRYVVADCDESCIDIRTDCAQNKQMCRNDIFRRQCDHTCRSVCRCGSDKKQLFKGPCMQREDGKWSYYKRIVNFKRNACKLCEMEVQETFEECVPEPCDENEIKVVGDCIEGVKLISIYSRRRHRDGSCPVILLRVLREDCRKCCHEVMKDVGQCRKYKKKGGYFRPVTHSWYVKIKGNCELKMDVRWFPCNNLACPRDYTTRGKCEFGRRLTYNIFYTVDRERNCVRHATAYKTYCKQEVRPECTDAYIDLLSPRQCLHLKKRGMCNRNEGASMCARTCNFCVIKKYCTKKMGPVDLVLIVDASQSIELVTFENYMVPFLRSVVGKMGRTVRVSVIQYGNSPKTVFRLGEEVYPRNMISRINHMDLSGGDSSTAKALYAAAEEFRLRGRRSAHKVAILVTDGRNSGKVLIKPAASRLKEFADTSIVVGIGNDISESEMRLIATDYASDEIRLSNYRQLGGVVDTVVTKICPKGGKPKPGPRPEPKPRPGPGPGPGPRPGPEPQPAPAPKPQPGGTTYPIDLYFVIDSSGYITVEEFYLIKRFIKSYVNSIVISPEDTRVGVIQYSDKVTTPIDIDEYKTVTELLPAIEDIKHDDGKRTVLGDALVLTSRLISRNDRNVPKVVIIISGTPPTNGEAIKEAAPKLVYYADKIITIGIKDRMPKTELLLISTTPDDTIIVETFTTLHDEIPKIIEKTKIKERRRRPVPSGTAQDIVFIVDSSDAIGFENWNIYIKGLLKVITEYVIVSPADTRFALIQFSKPAQVVFGFNDFTDGESLRRAINKLKPTHRSTYPSIGNAMKVAINYVKTKRRTGVPTSAIVITASTSAPRVGIPVEEIITEAHSVFDYIIPVAIRNRVDMQDLERLAKPDSSMIITTEELDELIPLSKRIISLTTVRLRRKPVVCRKRSRGDFVFVIGVSSRFSKHQNFEKIKSFIKSFASQYQIDEGASRGGVFILGSNAKKAVGLNAFRSDVDFKASINRLSAPRRGATHFKKGFEKVIHYVRQSRTRKRPTTMIYISDGSEISNKVYSVAPKIASTVRKTIVVGLKPTIQKRMLLRTMVTDVRNDYVNVRRFRDLSRTAQAIADLSCTKTGRIKKKPKTKVDPGVKRIVIQESKRTITQVIEKPKKKSTTAKTHKKKRGPRKPTATVNIEGQKRKIQKKKKIRVIKKIDTKKINIKKILKKIKKIRQQKKRQIKKKISIVYGTTTVRGAPQRYIKKINLGGLSFKTRVIRVIKGHGKRRRARRYFQVKYRTKWLRFNVKRRSVRFRGRWYKIRVLRRQIFVQIQRKWRKVQLLGKKLFVTIRGSKFTLNPKKQRKAPRKHKLPIRIQYEIKTVKRRKIRVPAKIVLGFKKIPVKIVTQKAAKGKKPKRKILVRISRHWVRFSAKRRRVKIGKGWFRVHYRKQGAGVTYRRRWYRIKVTKKGFKIKVARKWHMLITTKKKLYFQHRGKVTRVGKPLVVRTLGGKFGKLQRRKKNKTRRIKNRRTVTTHTSKNYITGRNGKRFYTGLRVPDNLRRRRVTTRTTTKNYITGRNGKRFYTGLRVPDNYHSSSSTSRVTTHTARNYITGRNGKRYYTGLVKPNESQRGGSATAASSGQKSGVRLAAGALGQKFFTSVKGVVVENGRRILVSAKGAQSGHTSTRRTVISSRPKVSNHKGFVNKKWFRSTSGVVVENGRRIVLNRFGKMSSHAGSSDEDSQDSHSRGFTYKQRFGRRVRIRSRGGRSAHLQAANASGHAGGGTSSSGWASSSQFESSHEEIGKPEVYSSGWITTHTHSTPVVTSETVSSPVVTSETVSSPVVTSETVSSPVVTETSEVVS